MASPEGIPRELSFLYSEDEKLDRPEECPRTVCKVTVGERRVSETLSW